MSGSGVTIDQSLSLSKSENYAYCRCVNCQTVACVESSPDSTLQLHSCHYENCNKIFDSPELLASHLHNGIHHDFSASSKAINATNRHTGDLLFCGTRVSCEKKPVHENQIETINTAGCEESKQILISFEDFKAKKINKCHYENCDKVFGTSSDLKRHHRVHTGERPHVCEWPDCGKKFSIKSSLKRHILDVHMKKKNFACDVCSYRCACKSSLTRHVKIHASNNLQACYTTEVETKGAVVSNDLLFHNKGVNENVFLNDTLKSHKLTEVEEKNSMSDISGQRSLLVDTDPGVNLKATTSQKHEDKKFDILSNCQEEKTDEKTGVSDRSFFTDNYQNNSFNPGERIATQSDFPQVIKIGGLYFSCLAVGCSQENVCSQGKRSHRCHYENCNKVFRHPSALKRHLIVHTGERPYACDWPDCGKKFAEKCKLKYHMLVHTKDRAKNKEITSFCSSPNCNQAIENSVIRYSNQRRLHNCHYHNCGKVFSGLSGLKMHLRIHTGERPYACDWPDCGKKFSIKCVLKKHKLTHIEDPAKKKRTTSLCSCSNCNQAVENNTIRDSNGRRLHNCHYQNCCKVFRRPSNLKVHFRVHTGERPYACDWPDCDKKFSQKSALKSHMFIHTSEKNYLCDFCGYSCRLKSNLAKHIKSHSSNLILTFYEQKCQCPNCQSVDAGGNVILNSDGRKLHNCHYGKCNEIFDSSFHLAIHLRLSHTGEPLLACEWQGCEKKFIHMAHLKSHMLEHENGKNYVCDICSFETSWKSSLIKHIVAHQDRTKPMRKKIKCSCPNCQAFSRGCKKIVDSSGRKLHNCYHSNCDKIFYSPSALAIHLKSHASKRQYSCRNRGCEKIFFSKSSLKKNMLNQNDLVYQGTRKIVKLKRKKLHRCHYKYCGKIFKFRSVLATHLRSHTGYRPHSCEWPDCNKKFYQKGSLKVHMLKHTGKKNYECDICGFRSSYKSSVALHIKNHYKKTSKRKAAKIIPSFDLLEKTSSILDAAKKDGEEMDNELPETQAENLELRTIYDQEKRQLQNSEKSNFEEMEVEIEIHNVKIEPKEEAQDYQEHLDDYF